MYSVETAVNRREARQNRWRKPIRQNAVELGDKKRSGIVESNTTPPYFVRPAPATSRGSINTSLSAPNYRASRRSSLEKLVPPCTAVRELQ